VAIRIKLSFAFFIILFSLVIGKAFYLQVANKEPLLAYGKSQYVREVKEYPLRGNIYDRNDQPLAININSYNIFTFPRPQEKKYKEQIKQLAHIVPQLGWTQLWDKVKGRKKYTWLAREIRLKESQILEIKKLNAIFVESLGKRVYPNGELLAQTLGFVGIDNSGLSGIERSFNKDLRGKARITRYLRDAKGRPIKYESEFTENKAKDLFLSIDKETQAALEIYLKEAVVHHRAKVGGAAVMDAITGEIWAVANYPTFDPNEPNNVSTDRRKLSFISDPFEPGSTFKSITLATALENKTATRFKKYYCEKGQFRVQNHIISEAETHKKYEWLTVQEILKESSNIGTTKIAFELKADPLNEMIARLKFGQKTGIELEGESRGIIPSTKKKMKPLTLSNVSFGHGIATTGLQMLRSYGALANGGYLVKPTLLRTNQSQITHENRVMSASTSHEMTAMLIEAVKNGTGKNAVIPHYEIAGKTGTAQRVSPRGGYEGHVASFIGYPVDVDKPFVVFVYIDDPSANGYYGNVAAAPVFKKITQHILYKRKDFTRFAKFNQASNVENLDQIQMKSARSRTVAPGILPSFVGMDKTAAQSLAKTLNIKVETSGYGVVTDQYPAAGTQLSQMSQLELSFTPPEYEE
jgi:cell division protein FtsI (penicillin-binding protein 3)